MPQAKTKRAKTTKTTKKMEGSETQARPPSKQLLRSRNDKIIGGVCGGIAEYLGVDSVWVRLIAVLLVLADGIGILLYIIAWIIIPPRGDDVPAPARKADHVGVTFWTGMLLILIGSFFLLRNLIGWLDWRFLLPATLIGLGVFLLVRK